MTALLLTHILMHCRPGVVSHYSITTPETLQSVQRHWLVNYGSQLPDGIPYIMNIRYFDDYDAPTIPYPSYCVLMPGGFSYTPHTTETPGILKCAVLKNLAGEYVLTHAFVLMLGGHDCQQSGSIHERITHLQSTVKSCFTGAIRSKGKSQCTHLVPALCDSVQHAAMLVKLCDPAATSPARVLNALIRATCRKLQSCLCCLPDALAVPNPWWRGTATVMLHKGTFNPQAATPAEEQTQSASSGWASAAQRHRETPLQPTHTAAVSFQDSDYLPAEEVWAAAPKAPDSHPVVVRRPHRPKIVVSTALKLLLQSSADLQQQQLSGFPSTQPAESQLLSQKTAGATPLGQIVLKARSQYTPSAPMVPKLAPGQQSKLSAAAQSGTAQVPGSAAVAAAAQGLKRPAVPVPAGTSVVPALLKRPKLAGHAKPPIGKAAASQAKGAAAASKGQAAGRPVAAKKAVSKSSSKVPGTKSVPTSNAIQPNGHGMAASSTPGSQSHTGAATSGSGAANVLGVSAAAAPAAASIAASTAAPAPATAAAAPKAPRQRKKAEDIDLAEVEKKLHEKQAAGRLQDVSIPELKCFLKARKLPVGGKKSDLLARVEPLLVKA